MMANLKPTPPKSNLRPARAALVPKTKHVARANALDASVVKRTYEACAYAREAPTVKNV